MGTDVWITAGSYLLVAVLALAWSLTEVLQAFRGDAGRALKTGWSALFLGLNLALALFVYTLVRWLLFPTVNPWILALAAGLAWQALLRTQINLLQPLDRETGQAVSLSLSDLYGRFQCFCREQIDQNLADGRIRLLERATRLPAETLERHVRLYGYASLLHTPEEVEEYLQRLQRYAPEDRALLLASYLLREGGYAFLQKLLKERPPAGE